MCPICVRVHTSGTGFFRGEANGPNPLVTQQRPWTEVTGEPGLKALGDHRP